MSSGGGGNTTTTTKSDPWPYLQNFLIGHGADPRYGATPDFQSGGWDTNGQTGTPGLYGSAANYFASGGPQYYPGQTYVDPSQATLQAQQMQSQRAMGSPLDFAAQGNATQTLQGQGLLSNPAFGYLGQTASGGMLNSNPYIDQTYQRAADQITANTGSVFSKAGRYGSGLHAGVLGQALGDTASRLYGQNYANERQNQLAAGSKLGDVFQDERQRQMGALALYPQLANQDYTNISALGNVGQQQEAYANQALQGDMNRFNYSQQQPYNMLQQYSSILNPGLNIGGTQTSTQPYYTNPIGGAMGGAMSGAAMGSLFPGIGTGLGAFGGAALGYLGSR